MSDGRPESGWRLYCVACGDAHQSGECYCGCEATIPVTHDDVMMLRMMASARPRIEARANCAEDREAAALAEQFLAQQFTRLDVIADLLDDLLPPVASHA